jgi:Ca2+-binding RTX toxin-like protein
MCKWLTIAAFLIVLVGTGLLNDSTSVLAASTDVGYRDFSYGTGTDTPTGSKPQDKLWYTEDGIWWGVLFNSSAGRYDIYRFNKSTQSWSDTGTPIDARGNSKADTLWDGTHLYVASAPVDITSADQTAKLLRYSYDPVAHSYTLDQGFPVTVGSGPMEALTFTKDSTGELWITFTQPDAQGAMKVWVNHSQGSDSSWGTPFVLPAPTATNLKADDISAIVSFDLKTQAPKVGIMWSNQLGNAIHFAAHTDGTSDQNWQSYPPPIQGPRSADDHINIKSLETDPSGRVFAVTKTSLNDGANADPNAPLIYMLVLGQDNDFRKYVFARVQEDFTRPILMIDESNRDVYVFAAAPLQNRLANGSVIKRTIYYKKSPLDNISFTDGLGTPFIRNAADNATDSPTSTNQNVNSTSGLLVLASDNAANYYLHNFMDLGATPTGDDTTVPTISLTTPPDGITYNLNQMVNADYSCADEVGGSGLASCSGDVANGGAIDTRSTGTKIFTVTAVDNAGNSSSVTHSYTVVDSSTPSCTITGTTGNDTLKGTSGNDVICGFDGNDVIKGLGGDDILLGGDGNDRLFGGAGNDKHDGGAGNDTADLSGSAAVQVSLADGTATGQGSDSLSNIENVSGSTKNDTLTGSDADNKLVGRNGADTLNGAGGSDTLDSKDGTSGNDALDGGAGIDTCVTDATEASIVNCER